MDPTAEAVADLLAESKRRDACLSVYTHCRVSYNGRAESELEPGDRFVLYTGYLLRTGEEAPGDGSAATGESSGSDRLDGSGADPPAGVPTALTERVAFPGRDVLFVVAGLAVVLVSGDLLVGAATSLARGAGISEWVIGGTIVAAGTSTPEFAVSLVAMRSSRLGVSVGNVVGSNVFNMLGILGLAAAIQPLSVGPAALETTAWLVVVSVVMVVALWTGRKLSRVEGGLFAASELVRWAVGILGP